MTAKKHGTKDKRRKFLLDSSQSNCPPVSIGAGGIIMLPRLKGATVAVFWVITVSKCQRNGKMLK